MSDSPKASCLKTYLNHFLNSCWPGRTQYTDEIGSRFASNQRLENELLKVKNYLQDILETLKDYIATSPTLLTASILRKIVAFNRPRLQNYVRHLSRLTKICLETPDISPELSDKLGELRDLAVMADNRELEEGKCEQTVVSAGGRDKNG